MIYCYNVKHKVRGFLKIDTMKKCMCVVNAWANFLLCIRGIEIICSL